MGMKKGSEIFRDAVIRLATIPLVCVACVAGLAFMAASIPVFLVTVVFEWVLTGGVGISDRITDFVFDTVPCKIIDFFDKITR